MYSHRALGNVAHTARFPALALVAFAALAVAAGVAPLRAQQARPKPRSTQAPSQPAAPVYDGDWWLSLGNWERYGVVSGYEDCYTFEYRGSVPFTKEVRSYIDDLNKYFLADAARRKETVSGALDALRGASAEKSAPAAAGDAPAADHGDFDGKFWFEAEAAAQLGFVEGYLACHGAKMKDADARFSKPPSEYVELINKAYNITDDTDDVDPEKAVMKIADVLHGLKDQEPAPAPQQPGAARAYFPAGVPASLRGTPFAASAATLDLAPLTLPR